VVLATRGDARKPGHLSVFLQLALSVAHHRPENGGSIGLQVALRQISLREFFLLNAQLRDSAYYYSCS